MRRLTALGLLLLAPLATAADLLPTEATLGAHEARLVVHSALGEVTVHAEPPVLAGILGDAFAPTPRTLRSPAPWRGMEGVIEVVLRRDDPAQTVEVIVEDRTSTGIWVEWPPAARAVPPAALPLGLEALAAGALAFRRG